MDWFLMNFEGTRLSLAHADIAYCASPFIAVPGDYSVDLFSCDYAYCASPFVSYSRG